MCIHSALESDVMKKDRMQWLFVLIAISIIILACAAPQIVNQESVVATKVAATLAAVHAGDAKALEPAFELITATPEIVDTTPKSGSNENKKLVVAYTDSNKNIFLRDANKNTRQLITSGDVYDIGLSDDGEWLAFVRLHDDFKYSFWVIKLDGTGEKQLVSESQFDSMKNNKDAVGGMPYVFTWRPGTHELAFVSAPVFDGPGMLVNDDLWIVNADSGELKQVFTPGNGGIFYYSPDGAQLALVTPEKISLINADGSNRRDGVLTFPKVNTYSEFYYYPAPKWSAQGDKLLVIIPPEDPYISPLQPSTIWQINVDAASSAKLGDLNVSPFAAAEFSPDQARLAYLEDGEKTGDTEYELYILTLNGMSKSIYEKGLVTFSAWSPDSSRFIFAAGTGDNAQLGQVGGGYKPLMNTGPADFVNWVDNDQFLYLERSTLGWKVYLENLEGYLELVADLRGDPATFFPTYDFILQ